MVIAVRSFHGVWLMAKVYFQWFLWSQSWFFTGASYDQWLEAKEIITVTITWGKRTGSESQLIPNQHLLHTRPGHQKSSSTCRTWCNRICETIPTFRVKNHLKMISRSSLSTLRSGLYLSEWLLFNSIGRSSRILVSGSRFTSAATESDSSTSTESNASKTTEGGDASELESKLLEKDKLIEEKDKLLKEIQVCIWFSI